MEKPREKAERILRREDMIRILIVLIGVVMSVAVWASFQVAKPLNIYVVAASPSVSETSSGVEILVQKTKAQDDSGELSEPEPDGERIVLVEKSIDINSAGAEELDLLPGIGPVLAERIVQYREENGDFDEISEIREVSGIGDRIFRKISAYIVAN